MSKLKKYLRIFLLTICTVLFAANAYGDLGDFNDYDDDSGWYDSDWGDDDNSWDDDDDNYSYGYYGGGGGNHTTRGGNGASDLLIAIIFVIIIIAVIRQKNKGQGSANNTASQNYANGEIKDNTDEIVAEIIKIDPNFSETRFMSWAKEVMTTLQLAWSHREWNKVRPFVKEEMYRQRQLQIQEYIDNGRINVIERININNAHFFEYKRDNQYEYLTVFMKMRMVDYIKDENTGQVIKGDPNKDCYPRYLLTFMRRKGVLTDEAVSNKSTTNCPNCGAPTQITSSGQCEYCDSVITTGDYDWVLSDMQGVKKNVSYGDGGVKINE